MITEVPRLEKAAAPITRISTDSFVSDFQCGENLCIGPSPPMNIHFSCAVMSSDTPDYEINIYRDDSFYIGGGAFILTKTMVSLSLGTYKTVLNDSCGIDIATSVLSLCGKLDTYIHTY